jgi:heptose-I-phosphate ethanolaminephosphotransferase
MRLSFSQKYPLIWLYGFFFYFSGATQFLILASDYSGTGGLRNSIVASTLWLIPILLYPSKAKAISATIGGILWAVSMVALGYWLIYSQDFSQSVLFIIFESNFNESQEFIRSYFQWWFVPVYLLFTAIPYMMWKQIGPLAAPKLYRYKLSVILLLIFSWPILQTTLVRGRSIEKGSHHLFKRIEAATPWNLIIGYSKYRTQLADMEKNLEINRNAPPLKGFSEDNKNESKTMVLVIGESTNRQKMSLYGYQRKTTPNLDQLKDELFVFNDVISPRPYTIEALQQVLSFANQENIAGKGIADFFKKPTLLNMMKQAGYEITWITNQQTQTKRNTLLTTLSQLADHQVYLNNNRDQNAPQYDESVINPFEKALTSTARKKLIVVHLIGTHRIYSYRYPPEFNQFTTHAGAPSWITDDILDTYNSYDNAVLYNDHVVSELIKRLKKSEQNELLIYFSDHGEEVYDHPKELFTGRNEGKPTPPMYTIPFLIWASPKYLEKQTNNHWKNYLDRPYSISDFIYTWSDLVGLRFDDMDYSRSLISDQFTKHTRWIGTPDNKKWLRKFSEIADQ